MAAMQSRGASITVLNTSTKTAFFSTHRQQLLFKVSDNIIESIFTETDPFVNE